MYSRLAATVAAGVLVMSGLATGTANASTAPTVTATPECGKVTITVVNPTEAPNLRLQVQADHGRVRTVAVAANGVPTAHTVTFREDSGRHLVRWRLWGGPERDWDNPTWHVGQFTDFDPRGFRGQWAETVRVESDCLPNFERADAPTVVQPECDAAKGKLVIPADRGVTYKVRTQGRDYRTVRAGEYDVRPGTYWVRAYAKPGVKLVGVDRWRLEVEAAEACPTPTPTPTATDEPTPTPTVTPTDPPAEEPSEEPEPQPTITETTTEQRTIVIRDYLPVRVDTGLGGTARNAR
jgi:hypothetical protein